MKRRDKLDSKKKFNASKKWKWYNKFNIKNKETYNKKKEEFKEVGGMKEKCQINKGHLDNRI